MELWNSKELQELQELLELLRTPLTRITGYWDTKNWPRIIKQ